MGSSGDGPGHDLMGFPGSILNQQLAVLSQAADASLQQGTSRQLDTYPSSAYIQVFTQNPAEEFSLLKTTVEGLELAQDRERNFFGVFL